MGVDQHPSGAHRSHHVHPAMNTALATPLFVLGGGILILAVLRLLTTLRTRRRLHAILEDDKRLELARQSSVMAWLNRHLFYAPLLSLRHSREFRIGRLHMGTVPLRFETLLIVAYIGINVAFFVCLIDWWEDYQEVLYQVKYAGGHLAVMNLPAITLTASRNNLLIPLHKISFDTFNFVHRWIGRLIGIATILHVAGVVAGKVAEAGWEKTTYTLWHVPFFIYGMVALIGFMTILIQSVSPLRHAFYEVFLHLHILLVIVSFVGLWYHLRGLTQQYVLDGAIALWALERAVRLATLAWRNWRSVSTTTEAQFLAGDVVRVEVALARTMKFKAGQYMYLYIPSLSLWTSHPFSVAWTSTRAADRGRVNSSDSVNSLITKQTQTTVSFLIKKRDGFTRKLLDKASQSDNNRFKATVLAEGPFGGLHSFNSFGTVVMVAGGIGVTHPMSYMHQFLEDVSNRSTGVRRIVLVWVVQSLDYFDWIRPWMDSIYSHHVVADRKSPISHYPDFDIAVKVYVTSEQKEESMYEKSDNISYKRPGIEVTTHKGRPDFEDTVKTEKDPLRGAMAVTVCGPGGMCDDVRDAVRKEQGAGIRLELFEESFTW